MANEISVSVSLGVNKPGVTQGTMGDSQNGLQFSMTGTAFVTGSYLAPITPGAIPLAQVTQPHWASITNNDPTNYVQLQNGASGAVFCRLLPGEVFLGPLDPGCVPYAIANTAPVQLSFWIFSL